MDTDSSYKILILEDIKGESELLQHEIRKSNVPVVFQTAANRIEFHEKMISFHPELIVSDDSNTELAGVEIISAVRSNLPDAKLIMVSIDYNYDKIVHYFAMGADNFIYYDHIVFLPSVVRQLYQTRTDASNQIQRNNNGWPPVESDEIEPAVRTIVKAKHL